MQVGGRGKLAKFLSGDLHRKIAVLKLYAKENGVKLQYYLAEGADPRVIQYLEDALGKKNVQLFKDPLAY